MYMYTHILYVYMHICMYIFMCCKAFSIPFLYAAYEFWRRLTGKVKRAPPSPQGFPSGIIRQNWNDAETIIAWPLRKDDTHKSRGVNNC